VKEDKPWHLGVTDALQSATDIRNWLCQLLQSSSSTAEIPQNKDDPFMDHSLPSVCSKVTYQTNVTSTQFHTFKAQTSRMWRVFFVEDFLRLLLS